MLSEPSCSVPVSRSAVFEELAPGGCFARNGMVASPSLPPPRAPATTIPHPHPLILLVAGRSPLSPTTRRTRPLGPAATTPMWGAGARDSRIPGAVLFCSLHNVMSQNGGDLGVFSCRKCLAARVAAIYGFVGANLRWQWLQAPSDGSPATTVATTLCPTHAWMIVGICGHCV